MTAPSPVFAASITPTPSLSTERKADHGTSQRDLRIDFFRGVALLMIFVDHVSGNKLAALTLQRMGFADAAEVFVFIAGLTAVLAYRKVFNEKGFAASFKAVFARIRVLYFVHLVMVAGVVGLAAYTVAHDSGFDIIKKLGLEAFLAQPAKALLLIPVFGYMPNYLDILPLYVILLALIPFILLGQRLHVLVPLCVATAVYLISTALSLNLPNLGDDGWFLNPLTWALLFVSGATVAQLTLQGFWEKVTARARMAITLLAAGYVAFAFIHAAPWRVFPALESFVAMSFVLESDKAFLSWHRMLDLLAKVWLVAVITPRSASFMTKGLGGAVSRVGRNSLPSFAIGVFLSLIGSILLFEASMAPAAHITITVVGIMVLFSTSAWLEWSKSSEAQNSVQLVATAHHG